ncbi:MAG: hypothetical protein DRI61_10440 [Chloroflexi bacterium]|nr:MAG: hypothetical protein DRI61_10440 [Chloroflexota bacterium]
MARFQKARRIIGIILIILGLALWAGWGVRLVITAKALYVHLKQAQAWMEEPPKPEDLPAVEAWLQEVRGEVLSLKREAAPALALAPYLGWIPRYGGDIRAAPFLLDMADGLTQAGLSALEALSPAFDSTRKPGLEALAYALNQGQGSLAEAREGVRQALRAREQMDVDALSPRLKRLVLKLDPLLSLLYDALSLAPEAPELLGMERPYSYLILAQNSDELRATGGFITGAGFVTLDKGRIAELSFQDSYAVDDLRKPYPPPPTPLYRYMLAELWLFRDSNWSPDFPTSARQAAYFFTYGTGKEVDGVIAVDFWFLRMLIEAVEPLNVPGFEEPLTRDNVMDLLRAARGGVPPGRKLGGWWKQRKSFMSSLAQVLQERLEKGDVNFKALFKAVWKGLREKHLLIYVKNPRLAGFLAQKGWDGALEAYTGDFLMVVDSNVGFNKVNPLVEERISYEVNLESLESSLHILYINHSRGTAADCDPSPRYEVNYEEDMHRCYWNYLRVYVPEEAQLLEATPAPLPELCLHNRRWGGAGLETLTVGPPEFGRNVFALYFLLPRGEQREQSFRYRLPQAVIRWKEGAFTYSLKIQKQPGTLSIPVEVRVILPSGATLLKAEPQPVVKGQALEFSFALDEDQVIEVKYK